MVLVAVVPLAYGYTILIFVIVVTLIFVSLFFVAFSVSVTLRHGEIAG
jgi:hypothetical protein